MLTNEEKLRKIGEAVARRRVEEGLSQKVLARMIGNTSHAHLSRVERGEAAPSMTMLLNLADALDVHVTYFFTDI